MKPLQWRSSDPDSRFTHILKFFIRLDADRPSGYRETQVTSPNIPSEDDTEGTTEYYQLTRSDVANSDVGKTSEEEAEL